MKFGIFVCILVVLAVHEAVSYRKRVSTQATFPAYVEGDCKQKDLPSRLSNNCWGIRCHRMATGETAFSEILCPQYRCANGKELGHGPYDLTKPFPACCNNEKCD